MIDGGKRKEWRLQGRLNPYYPFLRHFHIIITVVTVILPLLKLNLNYIITSVITSLLHIKTSVFTSLLHVITEIMDHCYILLQ